MPQIIGNSFFAPRDPLSSIRPSLASHTAKRSAAAQLRYNIHKTLSHLFSPYRHNYRGVVAAFDRSSESQQKNMENLNPSELHTYFSRFIKGQKDSSKALDRCIDGLGEQLRHLEKTARMKLLTREIALLGAPKKLKKIQDKFNAHLIKEIQTLKEGEKKLILASNAPGDSIYYLFSKENNELNFKVIGRGQTMANLTKSESVVKEKICIRSSLSYTNLPLGKELTQWLNQLLDNSSLSDDFSPGRFTNLVSGLTLVRGPENPLSTKTESFAKSFWSALKEVKAPTTPVAASVPDHTQAINRRLYLRVELGTLFEMFHQCARDLRPHTEEIEAIATLMREVSHHVLIAYEKKDLSKADLEEIVPELTVIQQTCERIQRIENPALMSLQNLDMSSLATLSTEGICEAMDVPEISASALAVQNDSAINEASLPIPPHTALPPVARPTIGNDTITTSQKAIEVMRTLIDSPSMSIADLNQAIALIKFAPIHSSGKKWDHKPEYEKYEYNRKGNDFFVTCSEAEAKEMIALLQALFNNFFTTKQLENLSVDAYQTYKKLLSMVVFLSYRLDPFFIGPEDNSQDDKVLLGGVTLGQWKEAMTSHLPIIREAPGYHKLKTINAGDVSRFYSGFLYYISREKNEVEIHEKEPLDPHKPVHLSAIKNDAQRLPSIDSFFDLKRTLPRILRPFSAPSLAAAVYSSSGLYHDTTQEAIRDNVQQVLDQFLEKYNKTKLRDSTPPTLKQKELTLNDDDLKELLLMRATYPRGINEILPFITQYPHLLENSSVRQFIDVTCCQNLAHLHNSLQQYISRQIPKLMEATKEHPELTDQLLFFLDLEQKLDPHKKLNPRNEEFFLKGYNRVKKLLKRVEDKTLDVKYLPRLWMQHLGYLFEIDTLTPEEIQQTLVEYHLLKGHPGTAEEYDPALLQFFDNRHRTILKQLCLDPQSPPDINAFHSVLNQICHGKGKQLSNLTWSYHEKGFPIFTNGQYEIDLARSTLSLANSKLGITNLPLEIKSDPFFKDTFGELPVDRISKTSSITSQTVGEMTLYFFKNIAGHDCRIEREEGVAPRYYKKIDGVWLQALSSREFQLEAESQRTGIMAQFKPKTLIPCPQFMKSNLYMDPKDLNTVYHVNDEGKKLFRIQFKVEMSKKSIRKVIDSVIDMRTQPESGPCQVQSALGMRQEPFKTLSAIEHPSHMFIWGTKEKIEKIELPRYGLEVSVQGDQLVCTNEQYKGYQVKINAPVSTRLGLPFSLLLEHSDPSKSKIILMPDASVIDLRQRPRFLNMDKESKVFRFTQYLKMFISMVIKREMPDIVTKTAISIEINPETSLRQTYAIELRPRTQQILYKNEKIPTILNMLGQAIKMNSFEAGLKILDELDFNQKKLSQKDRQILSECVSFDLVSGSSEASLKLKFIAKTIDFIDTKIHKDAKKYVSLKKHLIGRIPSLVEAYQSDPKLSPLFHLTPKEKSILKHLVNQPIIHEAPQDTQGSNLIDQRIQSLEDTLQVHQPVADQAFSRELKLLPGQGTKLVFDSQDLAEYYVEEEIPLPVIDLKMPEDAEACEVEAIRTLQDSLKQEAPSSSKYMTPSIPKQKQFVEQVLEPKIQALAKQVADNKQAYQHILTHVEDAVEKAKILSQRRPLPTDSELMFAVMNNGLQDLKDKGKLPQEIDVQKLKTALLDYYDSEVQLNIAKICHAKLLKRIQSPNEDVSKQESKELLQLLTATRRYSVEEHPELLCFEMLNFMSFRKLNDATDQIDLMVSILAHPDKIVQAGTGSGKTTVLSILRGLMKPQGNNLVILKVLPGLLKQTISKMHSLLEDPLKVPIHEFQFNLGKDLFDAEKNSIFKGLYLEILQTIQARGCLVTDYKSLPLLEEKWIHLTHQLSGLRKVLSTFEDKGEESKKQKEALQQQVNDLTTHVVYLKKILKLLKLRGDEMMDEFDQPNRPVHRLQITLTEEDKRPSQFFMDKFTTLYELLAKDPELRLKANLQQDMDPKVRMDCIHRNARLIAGSEFSFTKEISPDITEDQIYNYLIGTPGAEHLLTQLANWSPSQKDALAFYKEQFWEHGFLSLTLGQSQKSRYKRNEDGTRVIPCLNGKPNEGSKFGNWMEEFNYCIQDYYQSGIGIKEMRNWVSEELKRKAAESLGMKGKGETSAEKHFFDLFGKNLTDESVSDEEIEKLVTYVASPEGKKVFDYFLENRLLSFSVSGEVISMTPQNTASMSHVVSGISATIGSPDALHKSMRVDREAATQMQKESLQKFYRKLSPDHKQGILTYQPENPMNLFERLQGVSAIIDGAGAFKEFSPEEMAQRLLESNPELKGVGYVQPDGSIAYVGTSNPPLGFFFSEADTVGLDVELAPDAKFALTIKDDGDLEWMFQHAGRSRLPGQQLIPVCSSAIASKTIDDVVVMKLRSQARKQADDTFTAKIHELHNILRSHAREYLLQREDEKMETYLDEFDNMQDLFITPAAPTYEEPGSYFTQHCQFRRKDHHPLDQLNLLCKQLVDKSIALGLPQVAVDLTAAQKSYNALLSKLPSQVAGVDVTKETEFQIEREVEQELEQELQQELMIEQELHVQKTPRQTNIKTYLPRKYKDDTTYPVSKIVDACYSPLIEMSEHFLQLSRKGVHLMHERRAFDQRMYRVGKISLTLSTADGKPYYKEVKNGNATSYKPTGNRLSKLSLVLEDVEMDNRGNESQAAWSFDIRTGELSNDFSLQINGENALDLSLVEFLTNNRRQRYKGDWPPDLLSSPKARKELWDLLGFASSPYNVQIIRKRLQIEPISKEQMGEEILRLPEVQEALVQIKFLDARTTGYTENELVILEGWIKKSGVKKMRHHFENEVLRYRDDVRRNFPQSQLWVLFEKLTKEELVAQDGI